MPSRQSPDRLSNRRSQKYLVLLFCLGLSWSLAIAIAPRTVAVDPVPQSYQLGLELYQENCGTCHMALPPAVMPRETWQQLLQDREHYGVGLQLPIDPPRLLIWQYLQFASRPLASDEETPYRLRNSRYFQALHPRVKIEDPITISSCVQCHPGAMKYDFRSLTPEWLDSQ